MLGCLNFPHQCLPQLGTLKEVGPCHFSFAELTSPQSNQYQAYGQGTSQKELSYCQHALSKYLPKG